MFSIELDDKVLRDDGGTYSKGTITLGPFHEAFHSYLHFWKKQDYERHWRIAVERILRGEKRSALITGMQGPNAANPIFWWPMWREGDMVHIQNHLLFLDKLKTPLDPSNPFPHVRARRTGSKEKVSQWTVPISDIAVFAKKRFG